MSLIIVCDCCSGALNTVSVALPLNDEEADSTTAFDSNSGEETQIRMPPDVKGTLQKLGLDLTVGSVSFLQASRINESINYSEYQLLIYNSYVN